jgi:hypothetical protein
LFQKRKSLSRLLRKLHETDGLSQVEAGHHLFGDNVATHHSRACSGDQLMVSLLRPLTELLNTVQVYKIASYRF